jgi:hypothetical protein
MTVKAAPAHTGAGLVTVVYNILHTATDQSGILTILVIEIHRIETAGEVPAHGGSKTT